MPPSLEPDLLRAFTTVAETRSVSRAAKLLHLSQSAASLQIRRLEQAVGAPLFVRSPKGVSLTPAGEALLGYAERLLALQEEAVASVRRRLETTSLRVGMPDVYAARFLPGVLPAFRERYPDVRPAVTCDVSTRLIAAFEAGDLDVALVVRHADGPQGEVLAHEDLFWVADPGLSLDPAEPLPLALYPDYCIFRAHGLRALARAERPFAIAITSQSTTMIDVAIAMGMAATIKAGRTLQPEWRVLGEAEGLPPIEPVDVELHRRPGEGAVRAFADLLARRVREDGG